MGLFIKLTNSLLVFSIDLFAREVVEHQRRGRGIHFWVCFSMVLCARLRPIVHRLMGCRLVSLLEYLFFDISDNSLLLLTGVLHFTTQSSYYIYR